ncbi:MAG: hypothetical protein NVSMB64_31610 [Candidatus Velthaea sp.]
MDALASRTMASKAVADPTTYAARIVAIKRIHPKAYAPWSLDDDKRLASWNGSGADTVKLARELGRQTSAIRSRLRKLGMLSQRAD